MFMKKIIILSILLLSWLTIYAENNNEFETIIH